jgi:23S rRNA pseudoU1915 N3-methylase RlmH
MTLKLALTLLLASAGMAQVDSQNTAAALKESLAQNQARLRTYSWIETTQISLKGEVKKQEEKQCYYGADGKVQKTPAAGAPASAPPQKQAGGGRRGGKMKERVVENKVDDMKEYMERVAALVHEYVPPDPQKIQAAQAAGTVSAQPSGNAMNLSVKNYFKPGDLLAIGFDTTAKQLSSYRVQSFVEKAKEDDVTLSVTFGSLQDGTSYPQQVLLDVTAKKIQVKVTNSGYKKTGS